MPPTTRSCHHGLRSISSTQAREMFQSSLHVVVVEDHRARDGREQPADHRVAPGLPVEAGVLLEVERPARRAARSVSRAARMNSRVRGRALVDVDLVAEQEEQLGPLSRSPARPSACASTCRASSSRPVVVLVLGQRVGRLVRDRDPAGAEADRRAARPCRGCGRRWAGRSGPASASAARRRARTS